MIQNRTFLGDCDGRKTEGSINRLIRLSSLVYGFNKIISVRFFFSMCLVLWLPSASLAQGWISQIKSPDRASVSTLASDKDGNLYATSSIVTGNETVIYGRNQNVSVNVEKDGSAYSQTVLTKYSLQGNIEWAVPITSRESIYAWTSHYGADGHYYVAGNFKHDATFHSTNGKSTYLKYQVAKDYAKPFLRFFIAKYNPKGELQWVKTGHSWDNMVCFRVISDEKGNAYAWIYTPSHNAVIGEYSIFNSPDKHYVQRNYGIFIKINSDGEMQWLTRTGDNFYAEDIWLNEDGNLSIAAVIRQPKYVFKYADGTEEKFEDAEKPDLVNEFVVLETTGGKVIQRDHLFPEVKDGVIREVVFLDDGYLAKFDNTYTYEGPRKSLITINGETYTCESPSGGADCYFVKFDKQMKLEWYCGLMGRSKEAFKASLLLDNGRLLMNGVVSNKISFLHSTHEAKNLATPYAHRYFFEVDEKDGLVQYFNTGGTGHFYKTEPLGSFAKAPDNGYFFASAYAKDLVLHRKKMVPTPRNDKYVGHDPFADGYVLFSSGNKREKGFEIFDDTTLPKIPIEYFYTPKQVLASIDPIDNPMPKDGNTSQPNNQEPRDSLFSKPKSQNEPKTGVQLDETFVYPNPVAQSNPNFNLSFTSNQNKEGLLQVVSQGGKMVYSENVMVVEGDNLFNVQLPSLVSPGLFIVRLQVGKSSIVHKLIVN